MELTTHVFRIEGMHCGSCALRIDDILEDLPGVHIAQTTLKHRRSTVELDLRHNTPEDVIAAIEALGYRAAPLP